MLPVTGGFGKVFFFLYGSVSIYRYLIAEQMEDIQSWDDLIYDETYVNVFIVEHVVCSFVLLLKVGRYIRSTPDIMQLFIFNFEGFMFLC